MAKFKLLQMVGLAPAQPPAAQAGLERVGRSAPSARARVGAGEPAIASDSVSDAPPRHQFDGPIWFDIWLPR